ncbi:MAG: hypothetical protein JEY79_05085, partial [Pseudodesulfovibrio sp.]|nr:hypothetical protein [Pseudodesulfovibrio sp.]
MDGAHGWEMFAAVYHNAWTIPEQPKNRKKKAFPENTLNMITKQYVTMTKKTPASHEPAAESCFSKKKNRPVRAGYYDLERETRFELATSTLARLHSTTEL